MAQRDKQTNRAYKSRAGCPADRISGIARPRKMGWNLPDAPIIQCPPIETSAMYMHHVGESVSKRDSTGAENCPGKDEQRRADRILRDGRVMRCTCRRMAVCSGGMVSHQAQRV